MNKRDGSLGLNNGKGNTMRKRIAVCSLVIIAVLQMASYTFADSLSDRYARAVSFARAVFSPAVIINGQPEENVNRDADIQACVSDDYIGEEIMIQGEPSQIVSNVVVTDIVDSSYYMDVSTVQLAGDYSSDTRSIIVTFDGNDKVCHAEYNMFSSGNRDFITGQWVDDYSQRASLTISKYAPGDEYYCEIHWSSSYREYTSWRFHISSVSGSSEFTYSDCEKVNIISEEDGTETENVQYTNGTGRLNISGSGITWTDDMENAGEMCVFVKG